MKIILAWIAALLLAPLPVLRASEPSPEKTGLSIAGRVRQDGNLPHVVPVNGLPAIVVDRVQYVPIEIASEERAGKRDSGFADIKRPVDPARASARRNEKAAAVAVSPLAPETAPAKTGERSDEPVRLAASASPTAVDGKSYDVVIVGGTGGGVACAVRAAREGCTVLLVQHNGHIGGMMTNGLMQWDALYGGPRSPLFTEMLGNIEDHYIATFGRNSRVHQIIRYTHEHYPIGWAEPHVAEREYNRLVAAEENITLLLDHYPTAVERGGALIKSVTLRERRAGLLTSFARRRSPDLADSANRTSPEPANGSTIRGDLRSSVSAGSETRAHRAQDPSYKEILVRGATFVDATYEGDLFALAKVPYRVGREARDEYDEPHAGKVFVNIAGGPPPSVAREGLNIRSYSGRLGTVDPNSPFTADGAVQAYNYRFCVTSDPANRLPIPKPVYMQTGEAAGFAAALAKQQGTTPAALNSDLLVRTLVERRQLVSFFNDLKVTDPDPSIPAAQYFGTKGFFSDYNARLHQRLTEAVAKLWDDGLVQLNEGTLDPNALAARVQKAESSDSLPTNRMRGEVIKEMWKGRNAP